VKNRIVYISLAVVLAMSLVLGAIGCDEDSPEPIVIGMSRSLTGSLATMHQAAFWPVYARYTNMVNNRVPPGINVQGTYFPMSFVEMNDNSDGTQLIANTQALIAMVQAGDVHTIFGPTDTRMLYIMAPWCANASCVLMTAEGSATGLKTPGYLPDWPYMFINSSFSDWCQLQTLAPLVEAAHEAHTGQNNNVTAFIYWQDNEHGLEYLATAIAEFPPYITIVGNKTVLDSTANYEDLIELADKNSPRPDMVCCFCYPAEVMGLTIAAITKDYNFNAWIGGMGANFGFFGMVFQQNVEDVMCFAVANNRTSESMRWLFDDMIEPFMDALGGAIPPAQGGPFPGFYYLDFWGHPLYWAALEIWEEAIRAVGVVTPGTPPTFTVSQVDLKDKLHTYDGITDSATTILGDTYYDFFGTGGGILSCDCHTGEIGQWQADPNPHCGYYIEIVGGSNCTSTINYPKAVWAGFGP